MSCPICGRFNCFHGQLYHAPPSSGTWQGITRVILPQFSPSRRQIEFVNEIKDPIPPQIPDFIEPIKAYRLFSSNGPILTSIVSLNSHFSTIGEEFKAICTTYLRHQKVPEFNCSCGFYGFKTRKGALDYAKLCPNTRKIFLAKVHFTGKIIEHELGYRAERMTILWIKK